MKRILMMLALGFFALAVSAQGSDAKANAQSVKVNKSAPVVAAEPAAVKSCCAAGKAEGKACCAGKDMAKGKSCSPDKAKACAHAEAGKDMKAACTPQNNPACAKAMKEGKPCCSSHGTSCAGHGADQKAAAPAAAPHQCSGHGHGH